MKKVLRRCEEAAQGLRRRCLGAVKKVLEGLKMLPRVWEEGAQGMVRPGYGAGKGVE